MAASRQSWQINDAGILRRKDNEEELLVFGYSCKLFRDDEKALFIDQGKHLIPWMGDESLKIDRYDGRGTLYDLRQCEAGNSVGLTDAERRVEHLCDGERYRALLHNEDEEALYQEEELKRLHKALGGQEYGQVAFDYEEGVPRDPGEAREPVEEEEEGADEAFVAPPELDCPPNMVLPETVKLNAIVEKTTLFISSQGPQMEILLKMKQAGNPQFDFLSYDSALHPYYRHLLGAMKAGRYRPKQEQGQGDLDDAEEYGDDHYLHPSLAPAPSRVELAPSIPSISYKPSADCAYSMLVTKIKDKQAAFNLQPPGTTDTLPPQPQHREKPPARLSGSSSDTSPDCSRPGTPLPPPAAPPHDKQLIIDKMASYVAKNGRDFEAIVRSKEDTRFSFLDPAHEFYSYYQHKVGVYRLLEGPQGSPQPGPSGEDESSCSTDDGSESPSKPAGPVCFSIKKPRDSDGPLLETRSALPVEESSDDEGNPETPSGPEEQAGAELIDLTEEQVQQEPDVREKKWAEERVKDKLAAAARDKMAAASKEKQLQLERKRRATAFLSLLQGPLQPLPVVGPRLPDGAPVERTCMDEAEVASLPSPGSASSVEQVDPLRDKENGSTPKQSPLFARIQVATSKDAVKRKVRSRSSSGGSANSPARARTEEKHARVHRDKKKEASRKKGDEADWRTHRHHTEHSRSSKSKRKTRSSRSRSRSHSHHVKAGRHSSEKEHRTSHRKRARDDCG